MSALHMRARLISPRGRVAGITLVELMIAMLLGLLVAAGIVSVFLSTSSSNLAQTQLATLQEEGRFAIDQLTGDLRMANAEYCSNMGGAATTVSNGAFSLDKFLRAPKVLVSGASLQNAVADDTTLWGTSSGGNTYPTAPTAAFAMPSFLSMRGYDCTTTACTPVDPGATTSTGIPAMGTAVGKRVVGSNVLTLRYLDGARGWLLDGVNSVINGSTTAVTSFTINPQTGEPPLTDFSGAGGGLLMLSDCNTSQIFAGSLSGNVFTPTAAANYSSVAVPSGLSPKLFYFNRDFQTVTYYLQVVSDNNGHTTGALMRRLNGTSSEIVRGIERLDFLYGVMDANGNTSYRTASAMDSASGSTCASSSPTVVGSDPGCLWRSVQSIEVHILMDGQVPLYTLRSNELLYQYYPDTAVSGLAAPSNAGRLVMPSQQGFDDHLLRREFSTLISVRNYNP